jgi:hypothetical protein
LPRFWFLATTFDFSDSEIIGPCSFPEELCSKATQQSKQKKGNAAHGPTIAECAEKYIASRRHELGDKTIGQHRLLLERLREFCEARNAVYMRNLTVDLLETFKTEGLPVAMADTSKATAVAKLRCFLRTAYRRDWITESLVDKVTAHRAVYEQKEPYSDEEIKKILDGALELNGGTHGYARYPRTFRLWPEPITRWRLIPPRRLPPRTAWKLQSNRCAMVRRNRFGQLKN